MPCQSDGYCDHSMINRELDLLTRCLCAMIEKHPLGLPREVRDWWDKHQEWDRKCKAEKSEEQRRAQVKRDAYKKLTKEEKDLLHLRDLNDE